MTPMHKHKTIAVFAHPGHELRCFASLQRLSAEVLYLSDASASSGQPRLRQSSELLQTHGLQNIKPSLAVPDTDIYSAIMSKDHIWLSGFYRNLQQILQKKQPTLIITDSAEGYNPVHDLCHFLTVAAANTCLSPAKVMVTPLTDHPHELDGQNIADCMVLDLDECQVKVKVSAMNSYARIAGGQLADEAKTMEAEFGSGVHAREVLRPAIELSDYFARYSQRKPHFERYGEQRVQSNKYKEILRLHPHLAFALELLAELPECRF